jgi:plasmid stability protein
MARLTIRDIDTAVKEQPRGRAARSGRSMKAEVRAIRAEAAGTPRAEEVNLAEAIRRRFAPFGGVDDLEIHPRLPAAPHAATNPLGNSPPTA